MQWNGVSVVESGATINHPDIRHIRQLGPWCILGGTLVPTTMASITTLPPYNSKELIPIVIAAAVWGKSWSESHVRVKCDNAAVVRILNRGYSWNPDLMRCLHFITARFNFWVTAEHIQGTLNTAADALSCNSLHTFKVLMPHANQSSTQIPHTLVDLLMGSKPDWHSTSWTALFSSILTFLWHLLLNAPI